MPTKAFRKDDRWLGEGLREFDDEGGESGGAGRRDCERDFRGLIRPDSSMYGVTVGRRRPVFRASTSFSSSSISTSFISSVTPCVGLILYPSYNILAPKTRNKTAARKFVKRLGINVGTA